MGSTAAVAYLHGDTLITANVGDSRIYLVREDSIEQLTQDHTLFAEHIRKNPNWGPQHRLNSHEAYPGTGSWHYMRPWRQMYMRCNPFQVI